MALANEKLVPTHKKAPTFLSPLGLTDGIHQWRFRAFPANPSRIDAKRGDHSLQAKTSRYYADQLPRSTFLDNFLFSDNPPRISPFASKRLLKGREPGPLIP